MNSFTHFHTRSRDGLFLLAPDADAPAGGASPAAAPAAPANISIDTVPSVDAKAPTAPVPKAEPISVTKELGLQPRVQGPKEALGLTESSKTRAKNEQKDLQNRLGKATLPARAKTGQFVKAPDATAPAAPKVEEPATPTAPAAPEPPKPPVTEIQKIKIGEKEMTADEIKARLEELEAKAAPKKDEEPPRAAVEKKPEEIEAERKAKETEALATISKGYAPSEDELDTILSGGKKAVELFAQKLATVELNTRKWMEETLNPILKDIYNGITPIKQREQEIAAYTTEANFLNAHPDIKAHAQGQSEARQVNQLLHSRYDRIQQLIAANVATDEERAFAQQFEATTPEQFSADVAHHVRQRLGITAATAQPAAAPATPAPVAAAPTPPAPAAERPLPHSGQRPSGAGAPRVVSEQSQHVASIHGY